MHTSKRRNSIEAGSLNIESVDYRIVTSPVALVDIHQLSCEYGINELLRGHNEQHAGSQRPSMTNVREERHIVRLNLQNLTTTSWTISH